MRLLRSYSRLAAVAAVLLEAVVAVPSAAAVDPGRRLLVSNGKALGPIAADDRYLVWESGPLEGEGETVLRQRDRRTGKVTTLARGVAPEYGLVSSTAGVVYAATTHTGRTELIEIRHDGSYIHTLASSLLAPIDGRGPRVAWAEQRGALQRVLVRDLRTGTNWVVASFRRCRRGACYRVDAVTLASRGVAFDRGAVGTHPSWIVRRAFGDRNPARVAVRNDPQPDLVPSSAGALYYVLGRGWYRWDFARPRPQPTPYLGAKPQPLLRYEGGRWFFLTQKGCRQGLVVRYTRGQAVVVATPESLRALAGRRGDVCVQLTGLVWSRQRPIMAWAVVPHFASENHSDFELIGLLLRGRQMR